MNYVKHVFPPREYLFAYMIFFISLTSSAQPNLGNLLNGGGNLHYVALGTSLSAGVRNGGVYSDAQLTSFPALLAQQMGILDFKQALLTGNGTGFHRAYLDERNDLKFENVSGKDDLNEGVELTKYPFPVDNLSIPYLKISDAFEGNSDHVSSLFDKRSYRHLERLIDANEKKKVSYVQLIKDLKNIDFFTYEMGWQDFVQYINTGAYGTYITHTSSPEAFPTSILPKEIIEKKVNGVIVNVPDFLKFPVYHFYSLNKIQKANFGSAIYIEHWSKSHVRSAKDSDVFLPHSSIQSLFDSRGDKQGLTKDFPIPDEDVFDEEEQRSYNPMAYNKILGETARKLNIPVVDLYSLFERILAGDFVTNDGVLVNPSYPNGNFFSGDGITPTAFGQAIITNEIIRTINGSYNSQIPLIETQWFIDL